jgi:hypothetical protein
MFCDHIYSVRYTQDAHRNAQNQLQSFIVFYASKIPKYPYATENKVARKLCFLWLFYILIPYISQIPETNNKIWIENSFDTYDPKISDDFISPNWPKYWDSTVQSFWTLSINLYSERTAKFQKLLPTSGLSMKSQPHRNRCSQTVGPQSLTTATAQNTVLWCDYQKTDSLPKPSNPKLIHYHKNSSELTIKSQI